MRFVDTNVLLYAASPISEEPRKRNRALEVLAEGACSIGAGTAGVLSSSDARHAARQVVARRRSELPRTDSDAACAVSHARCVSRRGRAQSALPAVVLGRGDSRRRARLRLRRGVLRGSERPAGLRGPADDQSVPRAGEPTIAKVAAGAVFRNARQNSDATKGSDRYRFANFTKAQPLFRCLARLGRGKVIPVSVLTPESLVDPSPIEPRTV